MHTPVMLTEVLDHLNLAPGKIIVDATVGTAGHSIDIIKRISPGGKLICIDRDEASLRVAQERLADYRRNCEFVYSNFLELDTALESCHVRGVDGFVFDLGISSYQLDDPDRGFSFQSEGPLDMRLDKNSYISAYDLVNNLNEDEISTLLWVFGQERWHNRIARYLVAERQKHPISTTQQLSDIVVKAIPPRYRGHQRIHPATRTFQAVRIAVNREIEAIDIAITKAIGYLNHTGRICVIAFHSLEDRAVKVAFRKEAAAGRIKIITPKPLVPSQEEIALNPASRSAKFRVAEKVIVS